MRIKGLHDEDFVNYRQPSMFIGTSICDWKCCKEQSLDISICQNSHLANSKIIDISAYDIYSRYINNPITKAIVVGGLEPMLQFAELLELIQIFRCNNCYDDFVIYTGYYPNEIEQKIKGLKKYRNIVIKFGRFLYNDNPVFDNVLGITLASSNQYAERIS